jgi:hypothetical protein
MGDNDYIDSVLNANRDLNWVKRLYEVNPQSIQIPGQTGRSTHFLESADSRVYPTVVQLPDGSLKYLGPDAYDYADSTNSYIQFPTDKKAQWFAKNYKQGKDVLKGFESEKQQQTKGKKSMPNNPKKKAGESGKAAADMMSGLMEYLAMASPQATQAMPIPVPVQMPEYEGAPAPAPHIMDLLYSEGDNYLRGLNQALSKDKPDEFRDEFNKVYPAYDYYRDNSDWIHDSALDHLYRLGKERFDHLVRINEMYGGKGPDGFYLPKFGQKIKSK